MHYKITTRIDKGEEQQKLAYVEISQIINCTNDYLKKDWISIHICFD